MSYDDAVKTYVSLLRGMLMMASAIFYLSTGTKAPKTKDVLRMM